MNIRRAISLFVVAAATAAALWIYGTQPKRTAPAPQAAPAPYVAKGQAHDGQVPAGKVAAGEVVAIPDGKTLDFSDGKAVVKDSAADKAAMDAAVKEMDAATKDVSFPASTPPKK